MALTPAMPFKRKRFYHSPEWYREHCSEEDGGSPTFRHMLKNDMGFLDADFDKELTYLENIPIYEARWHEVLSDRRFQSESLQAAIGEVMEQETADEFRPERQFESEPFTTIERLMIEHGLDPKVMREFLNWRSRKIGASKRKETAKKQKQSVVPTEDKFFC